MQSNHPPIQHPQNVPVVPPAGALAPTAFGSPGTASTRLDGVRVLVVEDEPDSRELICALLEMAGAKVLCTESVAQALDGVCQSFDPDVVLTDFSMPDADGLDLISAFRKVPSSRPVAVPILILSGHSEVHWRQRALEAGAADVLTKPIDPALLLARILAAVERGPIPTA